eukprot:10042174-Alexandrium_andersonii.AAC.1
MSASLVGSEMCIRDRVYVDLWLRRRRGFSALQKFLGRRTRPAPRRGSASRPPRGSPSASR